MRRVGAPALLDGNVGEQMLEGAGARFVGADALGNRFGHEPVSDRTLLLCPMVCATVGLMGGHSGCCPQAAGSVNNICPSLALCLARERFHDWRALLP